MRRTPLPRLGVVGFALVASSGVAAGQPTAPSAIRDVPGPLRAAAVFGLVIVVGAGWLAQRRSFVSRAIDSSMERPVSSFLHGVIAFVLVAFVGFLAVVQAAQFGVAVDAVTILGSGLAGVVLIVLGSLGYVVVGAKITDVVGERRPWNGVVFGAAIGAVGWLLLPVLFAASLWLLGAAVGVGGPMREWLHADRSMASDGPV